MSRGDNVPCIKVLQATKLRSYHYPEVVNALRANSVLPESPAGLRTRRYCEVLRILTLLLSNTEGMTRPRLLLYSKGTDAPSRTRGTVHWGLPIIQYSQSPKTAMSGVHQPSGVATSAVLKATVCHFSGWKYYSWNNDLGVSVLRALLVTQRHPRQ